MAEPVREAISAKDAHEITLKIEKFPNPLPTRLHGFAKGGHYVDVTLKTDDGVEFPCHRIILAGMSEYFNCMFSSGMRESSERVVSVSGVSSKVFGCVIDFIYLLNCKIEREHFFDLLLVANMYEIKALESVLLDYITHLSVHADEGAADFLIRSWLFCQDYPAIVATFLLYEPYAFDLTTATPFKPLEKHVCKQICVSGWAEKLMKTTAFLGLNYDQLFQMLSISEVGDIEPRVAFDLVTSWIMNSQLALGPDRDPEVRFVYAKELLEQLDLTSVSKDNYGWERLKRTFNRSTSPEDIDRYLELIKNVGQHHKSLLLMPYQNHEFNHFVAHDPATGESFLLGCPDVGGADVLGTPQLMTSDDNQRYNDSKRGSLLCLQGVSKANLLSDESDKNPSLIGHHFSASSKKWCKAPMASFGPIATEQKLPLKNAVIIVPKHNPKIFKGVFSFLRISHGFDNEGLVDDKTTAEVASGDSEVKLTQENEEGCKEPPARNLVEVLTTSYLPGRTEAHLWKSLVPNLEVTGFGVYGRYKKKLGVVVLGNHFEDGKKLPISACGSSREKCPFPEGAFETPLSVVSFDDGIMALASSPFTVDSKNKKGNLPAKELKLPCLWLFQPHKHPEIYDEREQWIRICTPSFPDIDYATIFCNPPPGKYGKPTLSLVLVQRAATSKRPRVKSKNVSETTTKDDRIVGYFSLRKELLSSYKSLPCECSSPNRLSKLWEPHPISPATADFFALGCRLSGEVRITKATMSTVHLKPVFLRREDNGEVVVVVDPPNPDSSEADSASASSASPGYTAYQHSAHKTSCQRSLECAVNKSFQKLPVAARKSFRSRELPLAADEDLGSRQRSVPLLKLDGTRLVGCGSQNESDDSKFSGDSEEETCSIHPYGCP